MSFRFVMKFILVLDIFYSISFAASNVGDEINRPELFDDGWIYYREGQWMKARNAWYKYVELKKLDVGFNPLEQSVKVAIEKMQEIEKIVQTKIELDSNDSTVSSTQDMEKSARKKLRIQRKSSKSIESSSAKTKMRATQVETLMKKTRRAENQGNLDLAFRLIEMANKVDPTNIDVNKEFNRIKKLME